MAFVGMKHQRPSGKTRKAVSVSRPTLGLDASPSGEAGACGAGKAMVAYGNRRSHGRQLAELRDMLALLSMVKPGSQVEVAIVDVTVPVDGDQRAAHQAGNRGGVEASLQFVQIGLQVAG